MLPKFFLTALLAVPYVAALAVPPVEADTNIVVREETAAVPDVNVIDVDGAKEVDEIDTDGKKKGKKAGKKGKKGKKAGKKGKKGKKAGKKGKKAGKKGKKAGKKGKKGKFGGLEDGSDAE
jgi:hypothetical protein